MISATLSLITFFFSKLTIFIACSLTDPQTYFMQYLPLYTSYLFSMLLNEDIVDIEKPDRICLPTFAVDGFVGLHSRPLIFSIKHSRSA